MNSSNKKPRLFHASSNRNIELFEPRKEHIRDPEEGPVVFATPDPAYASCFIVRCDDSWGSLGRWGNRKVKLGPWVKVIGDRERYLDLDIGGKIYELPNDTFETDLKKGTGFSEWVSKVSVKPLARSKSYESGLDAMIEHNVQVFFTDLDTIRKIHVSEDHGHSIVTDLQKKGLSENHRRGRNVVAIK